MRFRFDLHTHTFYLKDTCNSPEEMIAAAVKRGLNGIAITDQDSCGAHEHLRGKILPPHFLVVPGVEVGNRRRPSSLLGATLPYMKGRRAAVLDTLDVNALEVFNAAVTSRSYNNKSRDYAARRGWQGIAASDAHHAHMTDSLQVDSHPSANRIRNGDHNTLCGMVEVRGFEPLTFS